ncbi:MAG: efflux RND transporter periplasmic adaptor subunit [Burkholderiaceae bacterium]
MTNLAWRLPVIGVVGAILLLLVPVPDAPAQSQVVNPRVPPDAGRNRGTGPAVENSDRTGCLIQPSVVTDVAAGAPGVLAQVAVERGQTVKRGQVLAVLDNDVEQAVVAAAQARAQAKASISAAEATRDMARQKLERMHALNRLSYGAQLELELAKGELKVAEHRLQQAREAATIAGREQDVASRQLAQREIRSPIDGIIADRLLEPGERVDGRPVVRVMNLDRLHVELVLPAERFGALHAGMSLAVTPEIGAKRAVNATVDQVDPFVDAASATFRARLTLANADRQIPAGARCQVALPSSDGDAHRQRGS